MKVYFLLPLTIVASVALVSLIKIRKKEEDKEGRRAKFQSIKLRVTDDVLGEYETERLETQNKLEKAQALLKTLEEEVNTVQVRQEKAKGDADICLEGQKVLSELVASQDTALNNVRAETEKERVSWTTELETLKQQLNSQSAICGFLKAGSDVASKLCTGNAEAPKPEEPKVEAPKPEEPKAEAPKPEEPKAEAPKPEAPKAEAPKPEEPKAEAPKK